MRKHILLICANESLALRIQIELLRHGAMVEIASTFRRGLAIAACRPPTAIILDAAIPNLDYLQLAGLAKGAGTEISIHVLILAHAGKIARAFQAAHLSDVKVASTCRDHHK